jgi:hypothetical protein
LSPLAILPNAERILRHCVASHLQCTTRTSPVAASSAVLDDNRLEKAPKSLSHINQHSTASRNCGVAVEGAIRECDPTYCIAKHKSTATALESIIEQQATSFANTDAFANMIVGKCTPSDAHLRRVSG